MSRSSDSGKPADSGGEPAEQSSDALPRATVVNEARPGAEQGPPTGVFPRWVWLAGAGALLVIGWSFILIQNNFNVTTPVMFVCFAYGAGVAAVYTLFRTGAAAVSPSEDDGDEASWGRPVGARAELEREKKALLKAIKEAEFDLQMGKLSKADAEAIIGAYRAQAIAVIREIDRKEGDAASAREQIAVEVRARLEVAKAKKAAEADKRPQGKKGRRQQAQAARKSDAAAKPAEPKAAQPDEATAKADEAAAKPDEATAKADEATAKADEATAKADEAAAKAEARVEDAVMADPRSAEASVAGADDGAGKVATP